MHKHLWLVILRMKCSLKSTSLNMFYSFYFKTNASVSFHWETLCLHVFYVFMLCGLLNQEIYYLFHVLLCVVPLWRQKLNNKDLWNKPHTRDLKKISVESIKNTMIISRTVYSEHIIVSSLYSIKFSLEKAINRYLLGLQVQNRHRCFWPWESN